MPGSLDDDVLRRARAGDEAAFEVLYHYLAPRLRRYALSMVGDDADDITGEAWLQIARDIRSFHGDLDGLRGWAARIVRNRAMDLLRYRSRRPVSPTPIDELFDRSSSNDTESEALAVIGTDTARADRVSAPGAGRGGDAAGRHRAGLRRGRTGSRQEPDGSASRGASWAQDARRTVGARGGETECGHSTLTEGHDRSPRQHPQPA